jgi:hypothetical protein
MSTGGGGSSTSSPGDGGVVSGIRIAVGAFLLVLAFMCSLCQGHGTSRLDNDAAASLAARPPEQPAAGYWNDDVEQQEARGRHITVREENGRPSQRASPAAGLPSFTYNPSSSVKHNVTGEEAACSVCLGAFQAGETVRLLPVCLHLYHIECIDPWMDAHSTCPICRSGTDPTMEGSLLPPV